MPNKWWIVIVSTVIAAFVLRILWLDQVPAALYWEEAALGYDAYAILKTGRDHHGNPLPVVAFESFGDWKPALYFYAAVPSIAAFGLNAWGVRFPSAVAGVVVVMAVGWILAELREGKKVPRRLVMIGMLITCISPWAIQFSRGGWEANLATALIAVGVAAGLRWLRLSRHQQGEWWLLVTIICLVLSMYAYHSARLMAPVLGLWLVTWRCWDERTLLLTKVLPKVWKTWLIMGVVGIVMLLPIALAALQPTFSQRFNETNIFADLELLKESQALQAEAGQAWWARIAYHRYVWYARAVLINALSHVRFDFLFLQGDANPRHSTQFVGLFYLIEVVALVVGLIVKWPARSGSKAFIAFWIGVAILITSLTKAVPHSLRILVSLPAWLVLLSFGWEGVTEYLSRQRRLLIVGPGMILFSAYVISFVQYQRYYLMVYPTESAVHWQYGYQQMVQAVRHLQLEYPDYPVSISRSEGRPAMYYWFYAEIDPRQVQAADQLVAQDQGEFLSYGDIQFPLGYQIDFAERQIIAIKPQDLPNSELVKITAGTESALFSRYQVLTLPSGEPAWVVGVSK